MKTRMMLGAVMLALTFSGCTVSGNWTHQYDAINNRLAFQVSRWVDEQEGRDYHTYRPHPRFAEKRD